jgi:hypothetical protein
MRRSNVVFPQPLGQGRRRECDAQQRLERQRDARQREPERSTDDCREYGSAEPERRGGKQETTLSSVEQC